jgi:NAD(P)-dependent dehydrogenase (short-subunit alcohol dehydrogenase family)
VSGQLEGKAGVIVGGTSGLGLAVLQAMTREGAAIVAVGRDESRGMEAVADVDSHGGKAEFFRADVNEESAIAGAIDHCRNKYGRLDIVHNNAGVLFAKELHETTNEEWARTLAVNLTAVFWGCKHAVLAMRGNGGGSIVNTASVAAFTAAADAAAYVAAKTGVLGVTRATALAYARHGIRCNALCPGDFDSPMLQAYFQSTAEPAQARALMDQAYPAGRILDPTEVASVAVFLASDAAKGVNGTSVVVDNALLTKTY